MLLAMKFGVDCLVLVGYPFLMVVIFFKAFPGISNVSQNGIKQLFSIIKQQFYGSEIDSKTSNLSYFNMGFVL